MKPLFRFLSSASVLSVAAGPSFGARQTMGGIEWNCSDGNGADAFSVWLRAE